MREEYPWPASTLGDHLVGKPRNGYSPKDVDSWTGTLALGLGCLTPMGFSPSQLKNIPANDQRNASAILQDGDLLISRANTRDLVGLVGRYRDVGRPCVYPDLMMKLTPARTVCPEYLEMLLRSTRVRRQIQAMSQGTSESMVKINGAGITRLRLAVPPLGEQRRIAEILDTLDLQCSLIERFVAKAATLRRSSFIELMRRGLSSQALCQSPVGQIPSHWEVCSIVDLLADQNPAMRSGPFGSALLKHELRDSGIPLLGIDNVHVERFVGEYTRFVDERKFGELERYVVRPGDLMITIMGTVGRCCVVPEGIGRAISSKHTWTITLDSARCLPQLACMQINHAPWVLNHFAKDMQGGIMSAIRSETLKTTLLPVPPMSEQLVIAEHLNGWTSLIEIEETRLRELAKLRSGLMEDVLTGRVRVSEAEAVLEDL